MSRGPARTTATVNPQTSQRQWTGSNLRIPVVGSIKDVPHLVALYKKCVIFDILSSQFNRDIIYDKFYTFFKGIQQKIFIENYFLKHIVEKSN